MKVRVQYTVEVSKSDLRALASNGYDPSRDSVKTFLKYEGVGGLNEIAWEEDPDEMEEPEEMEQCF